MFWSDFIQGYASFLGVAKGAFRNIGNFGNFYKRVSSSLHEPQGSASMLWSPFTALHSVYDVWNKYHEFFLRISRSIAIKSSSIFMMRMIVSVFFTTGCTYSLYSWAAICEIEQIFIAKNNEILIHLTSEKNPEFKYLRYQTTKRIIILLKLALLHYLFLYL